MKIQLVEQLIGHLLLSKHFDWWVLGDKDESNKLCVLKKFMI